MQILEVHTSQLNALLESEKGFHIGNTHIKYNGTQTFMYEKYIHVGIMGPAHNVLLFIRESKDIPKELYRVDSDVAIQKLGESLIIDGVITFNHKSIKIYRVDVKKLKESLSRKGDGFTKIDNTPVRILPSDRIAWSLLQQIIKVKKMTSKNVIPISLNHKTKMVSNVIRVTDDVLGLVDSDNFIQFYIRTLPNNFLKAGEWMELSDTPLVTDATNGVIKWINVKYGITLRKDNDKKLRVISIPLKQELAMRVCYGKNYGASNNSVDNVDCIVYNSIDVVSNGSTNSLVPGIMGKMWNGELPDKEFFPILPVYISDQKLIIVQTAIPFQRIVRVLTEK